MSLAPEAADALAALLHSAAEAASVDAIDQLSGGASRQTFAVTASGRDAQRLRFILQRELAAEPRLPGGMADEADLVRAANRADVPTPVVIGTNRDGGRAIGDSFFITERVEGETIARRILRDDRFAEARRALPAQLGKALAALHSNVDPSEVPWLEATDELAKYRDAADELDLVSPSFEMGFRWLAANRPPTSIHDRTVVHGDFRLGNLIIDERGLAAVIDWELGHLGDPMEDLGWLCVRAWRFGGAGPVAGVGRYEDLFQAYEQATGRPVDRAVFKWWETLGTLKWGVMCGLQSDRHLSGLVTSVELASIGPRVAEQEYDLLRLIHPGCDRGPTREIGVPAGGRSAELLATGLAEGGARPSAVQLIEAVRGYLLGDVSNATDGRTRFHALVAANTLATIGRELQLGDELRGRRDQRLASLGFDSERDLAAAIRSGALDDRIGQVAGPVMDSVIDRLAVNNPDWIEPAAS
jgi:aminoglycoside phosphotransferase (APT) family kinase protein